MCCQGKHYPFVDLCMLVIDPSKLQPSERGFCSRTKGLSIKTIDPCRRNTEGTQSNSYCVLYTGIRRYQARCDCS